MVWEAVPLLRLEAHFPATQLASFSTCHPAAALRVLNLNHNQLYGPIPKDLARLNSLEQLLLGDNRCGAGEQAVARLRGAAAPPPPMLAVRRCDGGVALPCCHSQRACPKTGMLLTFFCCCVRCRLTGTVPTFLSTFPNLRFARLDKNQFEGGPGWAAAWGLACCGTSCRRPCFWDPASKTATS